MPRRPSLPCASATFIARIANPTRRGKAVDLTLGTPGFANAEWRRGAYITTLARNPGEGLSSVTLAAIGTRVASWPTAHADQAGFDKWHAREITALGDLVKQHDPHAFWNYGRAQKFINILLKYACAAYHSEDPAFAKYAAVDKGISMLTNYLHAPVDSFTLKHTAALQGAVRQWRYISWSRALFSSDYIDIQTCLQGAATTQGMSRIHYEMVYVW